MDTKHYEMILDSLKGTGVYAVREDNQHVLYFNQWVRDILPSIETDTVCSELPHTASGSFLDSMKKQNEYQTTVYNSPFGMAVLLTAVKIMWQDKIPAFLITIQPHTIETGDVYQEIIRSLGEMNFGIYLIDLQTGILRPVRISHDIGKLLENGICQWDDILQNMLRLFHPEYRDALSQKYSLPALRSALERGDSKAELLCQRQINGKYHYVSVTVHFHRAKDQKNYAILAIQDVDEYTRREIQHSQNDKWIAVIMKSRYGVMNKIDLETGMCERLYLNDPKRGDRTYTGQYEKYIQQAARESVHEEDIVNFLHALSLSQLREKAKTVKDYAEYTCQYRIKVPHLIWIETQIFFVRQDRKMQVTILNRDITREKRQEEFYSREKKERTDIIRSLSSLFFAAYYLDLQEDTFRSVTQRNEVGELLHEELLSTEAHRLYAEHFVHPDDREELLSTMSPENLMNTLTPEHPFLAIEYQRIKRQNGTIQNDGWVRTTAILTEMQDGKAVKAIYVAQDVTESKRKEEIGHQALKEACEAAIYANASKSEFLSRMSHDIRTPMNAIIGMTAIAATHLDDPAKVSDCLNKITVSSKHLLALINEVLDMSKIESGKIDLSEEEFNLSDMIQNLITMIHPSTQEKEQKLQLHIVHVEHEDVIGDILRLQQVFMNILGNAVKYTPKGGNLEMSISEKPSEIYGYGCYEFVFCDTGIGMSREYIEKIFEPFSRAEDSRVSKIEGTGLGMTIALNIVHMMNGNITVESEEGKGSRFTVTVFLKLQDKNLPTVEQFVNLPVLVADDDFYACETTCSILDNMGMKSEWVHSGRDAILRVTEAHKAGKDFFAIILDWKMPEMDGVQTAMEIRKAIGNDVPIIILSAYDWSDVEAEARQAGVDGFISKPLFKSRLVYLFKKIANGKLDEEPATADATPQRNFQNNRILLVEDNELNREIAEEIIGSTGIQIETAADGREAVEKYLERGALYYDLIFMDIQMPVMNGYEATQAIRNSGQADSKQIPIVAMTANAFMEDVMASKRAGMNEHITKPLKIDELITCIERWVREK